VTLSNHLLATGSQSHSGKAKAGFREDKDASRAVTFDSDLNVESTADRNDQQVVAEDQDADPLNGQEEQHLIYSDVNDGYDRVMTRHGRIIKRPKGLDLMTMP